MAWRLLFVGLYLAAGIGLLVALNDDQATGWAPFLLLMGAALLLGWETGGNRWAGAWVWVLVLWGLYIACGASFADGVNGSHTHLENAIPLLVLTVAALALARWDRSDGPLAGWAWALLPWTLVVLGFAFGDSNKLSGDGPQQVAVIALFPALASMPLILLGASARRLHRWLGTRRRAIGPTS